MPNIGPAELIVILLVALVVFGPRKLPELGKSLELPPEKPDYLTFLRTFLFLPCEEGLQFKRMVLAIRRVTNE